MSVWQFNAALNGYVRAHSPGENKLSESEKDTLFDWIDAANSNALTLTTITYDWDGERLVPSRRITFEAG